MFLSQKETRGGVYAFASDRHQERDTKTSSGAAPSPRREKAFLPLCANSTALKPKQISVREHITPNAVSIALKASERFCFLAKCRDYQNNRHQVREVKNAKRRHNHYNRHQVREAKNTRPKSIDKEERQR